MTLLGKQLLGEDVRISIDQLHLLQFCLLTTIDCCSAAPMGAGVQPFIISYNQFRSHYCVVIVPLHPLICSYCTARHTLNVSFCQQTVFVSAPQTKGDFINYPLNKNVKDVIRVLIKFSARFMCSVWIDDWYRLFLRFCRSFDKRLQKYSAFVSGRI